MKKIAIIIVVLIVAGIAFYGGMKYTAGKSPNNRAWQASMQDFQNFSDQERQQIKEQFGSNMPAAMKDLRGKRGEGSVVAGEIIGKDAESITLELADGGSKIVFFSVSTEITKSAQGSADDLKQGERVTASGTENPDGSYTAETIRLIPRELIEHAQ